MNKIREINLRWLNATLSVVLIFCFSLSTIGQVTTKGKKRDCLTPSKSRYLGQPKYWKAATKLKFENRNVLKFKLASRKEFYRLGEMATVDLALLNGASEPLFFLAPSPSTVRLIATNKSGNSITIGMFEVPLIGYTSNMIDLVNVGDISIGHLQLLIGCKSSHDYLRKKAQILQETGFENISNRDRRTFEENAFLYLGDGCLDVSSTGKYELSAILENEGYVVSSECEPNIKTFIGEIESTPLTIQIVE